MRIFLSFCPPSYCSYSHCATSEIGRLPSAELEKDRGGAKSISAFLLELSARLPRLVFQHLVLLSVHLDGEVRVFSHTYSLTNVCRTTNSLFPLYCLLLFFSARVGSLTTCAMESLP